MTAPATSQTQYALYRQSWISLFLASVLAYTPFLFNFMWGNHDWQWVKEYTPLWSGVFEGRFSQFFLQTLLFGGNILPILTLLTGLFLFSAATVLICNLWHIPPKKYIYFLLGINLITSPYTLSWLYFAFITLSCLSWMLFIVGGYWLLNRIPPKTAIPAATVLFALAFGGYPPVINLIFVIFFSLVLNDLCLNKLPLTTIISKYTNIASAIALAVIAFLLIQFSLKKYGLQYDTYNTAGIELSGYIEKIKTLTPALLLQFTVTTSFISAFYKYIWLIITLTGLMMLFIKTPKTAPALFTFFCALIGLLSAPLLTAFAAQNTLYVLYEPRIDFFGIVYIYIYATAVLIRTAPQVIKNGTLLLLLLLAVYNIHTTAYAAKVWQFGFKAETDFADRFISRIGSNPRFNSDQNYTFVQSGTLDFRSRYYLPDNHTKPDSYTQTAPYIPWHLPSKAYKFYTPTDFFGTDFDIFWSFVPANKLSLTLELQDYLRYNAEPWPASNAVFLDENTIILTLSPEGKQQAQDWINNH